MPIPARYYPVLSEVLSPEDLPEFLSFVEDGIGSLLDTIHYKNLRFSRSVHGDSAFYSLDIVSVGGIGLPLFGGLKFVLNPDPDGDTLISSFPITVEYQWEIIAFLKSFSLNDFSFSVESFYQLGLKIFKLTDDQVLAHIINNFVEPADDETTRIEQFINDVTLYLGLSAPLLPVDPLPTVDDVIAALHEQPGVNGSTSMLLFAMYITDIESENETVKSRLKKFYNIMVPEGIENYIRKIITPKAKATLALSAGIEFPRDILRPCVRVGETEEWVTDNNESTRTRFIFAEADLYVDTEKGIGFNLEVAGSLKPQVSEIGQTGLQIQLESLKLDLSKSTNIPEADADGRPVDFTGVYARAVAVTLPSKWFKNPDNEPAPALRLGAYDLLVGTGGLSGTFMLETIPQTNATDGYFINYFSLHYPVTVFVKNPQSKIVEQSIANRTDLLDYLAENNLSSSATTFKFPITLTTVGDVTKTFTNATDYQKYLTGLSGGTEALWKKIGNKGFRVGFQEFDITLKQNSVTSSHIKALLNIPRIKDPNDSTKLRDIPVTGDLKADGDFNLTASLAGMNVTAKLGQFIKFDFLTVELGKEDEVYIGTSVEISFPIGIMRQIMEDQKILIPVLRFYGDGSFEIVGENGFLPVSFTLPLGPVKLSVSNIHIGTVQKKYRGKERKYNYIGFDGAISINPFLKDARGEGMKYYYTTDDDEFDNVGDAYLHIQTIEIDIVIPYNSPSVSIHGLLTIPEPGVSQEYVGEVSFESNQTSLKGKADMKLIPKYPAFIVDASVGLPVPIPLGPVSIYSFRGLIGHRYVADKKAVPLPDTATWYEYYKAPKKGISVEKFSGPEQTHGYNDPFSFGAGAVIGTSGDGGNAFSARVMMLLSLPSVFLMEGRISILSGKPGLTDSSEPPFFAVITYSSTSLTMDMGADYKLPKGSGGILSVNAHVEAAFFRNNSSNWYINFGTKERPITVVLFKDVVKLKAIGFLMISAQGIETGARLDFKLKKNFFGIIVKITAYVEVGAHISFERTHLGGYIAFGGNIYLKVWIIKLSAELHAILSAEAKEPYLLYAQLKFRVSVRIGFVRVRKTIKVSLKWERNNNVPIAAISPIPVNLLGETRAKEFVKGVHMLTNEIFELNLLTNSNPDTDEFTAIIPLDTFIDIKVVKGLIPNSDNGTMLIGGHTSGAKNFTDLIPPKKTVRGNHTLRQVKHKYSIESIEISSLSEDGWIPYHPYEAVTEASERGEVSDFKIGYWQRSGNQYDSIRILANSPMSYIDQGEPGWVIPEEYGLTPSNLFCHTESATWQMMDVLNKTIGTVYTPPLQSAGTNINGLYFVLGKDYNFDLPPTNGISAENMQVTTFENPHGIAKSLSFSNYNKLEISFPEDVTKVQLQLSTKAQSVTISYLQYVVQEGNEDGIGAYVEIGSEVKTADDLNQTIEYIHPTELAFIKIIIQPSVTDTDEVNSLLQQIEALFTDTYNNPDDALDVLLPNDIDQYELLYEQLNDLLGNGCSNRDAVYCDFYNDLMGWDAFSSFYDLFLLNGFERAVTKFIDEHTDADEVLDEYALAIQNETTNFFAEYVNFINILNEIPPALPIDIESFFVIMSNAAEALLERILDLGNCDCTIGSDNFATTSLQRVKWMTQQEFDYAATIPDFQAIANDAQIMTAAISRNPQPVWRPYTTYRLELRLRDVVDYNAPNPTDFTYYFGFKTQGPVGHFHNAPGVKYGNEYDSDGNITNRKIDDVTLSINGDLTNPDNYSITSLRPYIDYERSYPNADGNIINAKPSFYSHEQFRISVFFKHAFTFNMMNDWPEYQSSRPSLSGELNILIKDPVSNEFIPYPLGNNPGVPIPDTSWVANPNPPLPISLQILQNYIDSNEYPCTLNEGTAINPVHYYYSVVLVDLKPQKLYTALLNNAIQIPVEGIEMADIVPTNKEVHRFVFQTSRYKTFSEQIMSCYIKETVDGPEQLALFNIAESFSPTQIALAYDIVSTPVSNTKSDDRSFDRVIGEAFRLKPMDPPMTTEFNVIRNTEDESIVAVIIRNPEPFNDPKMPPETINLTIKVIDEQSNPDESFSILHSKDCSQAIIMKENGILDSSIKIRFQYHLWNGNEYAEIPAADGLPIDVTLTF